MQNIKEVIDHFFSTASAEDIDNLLEKANYDTYKNVHAPVLMMLEQGISNFFEDTEVYIIEAKQSSPIQSTFLSVDYIELPAADTDVRYALAA
jgi:hypothetical protein